MKTMIDKWNFRLDGSLWEDVTVPHDWAITRPINRDMDHAYEQGFLDRWGVGEYKTSLFVNPKENNRYFLDFDGVYENCTVSVNGQVVGTHKYGYSGFSFEITDVVKNGENELLVAVDNTTRPVDRWYSGCGIYRKVYLREVPCKYIDRNNEIITTDLSGCITIKTGLDEVVSAKLDIDGDIYEAEGSQTITMTVSGFEAWCAENPALYNLQLALSETGHTESFRIAFRDVQISAKGFFINGRQDKLRGVCVHQDASCFGSAVPEEIWRERFMLLKDYGVNAVRLAHHLFMPEVLDLCDEIGLYVYEESFDKWKSGLYERYYDDCWKDDIAAMVKRDRNRPSIIIWGVGNEVENQTSEESLEILSSHCNYVKQLDSTRPVTFAIFPWFWRDCEITDEEAQNVIDIYGEDNRDIAYRVKYVKRMAESVDIIGCNYQEPWYENYRKALPDMPILGTEIYQYFRGYPQNVNAYDDSIPWLDVEHNDYVVGGFVWAGFDYLGESMGWPAKGWPGALFATDMEPKTGAYIHRSYWDKKPFVHFAVMDYTIDDEFTKEQWDMPRYVSHWDFPHVRKSVVPYTIVSNCDEVILKLNDKIMIKKNPVDYKNRIVTGFIPYAEGKVEVLGIKDHKEVCKYEVATPTKAEKLEFDSCSLNAESNPQTVLLKVRIKDNNGSICFRATDEVSFEVYGDAEIIGVDNGNLLSHTPYNNTSVNLHRGRASVAVKVWGKAQIKATAANVKPAEIAFE